MIVEKGKELDTRREKWGEGDEMLERRKVRAEERRPENIGYIHGSQSFRKVRFKIFFNVLGITFKTNIKKLIFCHV